MGDKGRSKNKQGSAVSGRLWVVGAELRGLGVLLGNFLQDAILNDDDAAYGIGKLLEGIAGEIDAIRGALES